MKVICKGQYCYEPEFDSNKAHAFELILDLDSDQFKGIAVEEEFTTLTNEVPTITGFMDNEQISFTKQYPFQFAADENNQIVIDRSKPGHLVVYEGFLNRKNLEWEGSWEIISDEVRLSTDVYLAMIESGSWRMRMNQSNELHE
jgi:hypothetical protein